MSSIKIPLKKLPIFNRYIYDYIRKEGVYNLSLEFIKDNFSVTGYCKCGQNNCATVTVSSKVSLSNYKHKVPIESLSTQVNDLVYLHLNEGDYPIEFEYIGNVDDFKPLDNFAIYKDEVYSAVDNMNYTRDKVRKIKRYKKR